jgi:RNA polymerase sigma factor (sigma-70 family)
MSFEELSRKFSPTIKRITYKLNGRYRSFDHDDLYQEAILHLWNAFRQDKLADKTDSYILQGCYFHLKNYIRKINERLSVLSLESLLADEDGPTLEERLPLSSYGEDNIRESLNNKLLVEAIQNNGFDRREKKILMFFKDGLTTRDIGKRLGISHVSVVKMMAKIRVKSRAYVDKI